MIRIGTRGSQLATTQAQTIADALTAAGHPAELVIIKTAGDLSAAPVAEIGVGVFTTAIRSALRNRGGGRGRALVQGPADRIRSGPVHRRDPAACGSAGRAGQQGQPGARGAACGSVIGTSSPRRAAQQSIGSRFGNSPLRGNLDSRLGKVTGGELDAVVVARAGLVRIGRTEVVSEAFDPVVMLPAPHRGRWPSNVAVTMRSW